MTIALSDVVRIGQTFVAAIVECSNCTHVGDGAICIQAKKSPVAILVRHGNATTAFELDGRVIPSHDPARRYEAPHQEFERLLADADTA